MSESDELAKMEKALKDIYEAADEAMGEPNTGARTLMSFRWIKKLAKKGLGESDD